MSRSRVKTLRRLRRQDGVGLVELLIAMTILAIAIMGILAAFGAGMVSLQSASRVSTAGTIADAQMEAYRRLNFAAIKLDNIDTDGAGPDSAIPTTSPYTTDVACGAGCGPSSQLTGGSPATCAVALQTDPTCPSRTTIGANDDRYLVHVYMKWTCSIPGSTISVSSPYTAAEPGCVDAANALVTDPAKLVTIVVRNGKAPAKVLLRESSTFEQVIG